MKLNLDTYVILTHELCRIIGEKKKRKTMKLINLINPYLEIDFCPLNSSIFARSAEKKQYVYFLTVMPRINTRNSI